MEILIIILIVALLVQTCAFIYANFIDVSRGRSTASLQDMLATAQNSYLTDRERLQKCIDNRDNQIHEWIKKYNEVVNRLNALGAEYDRLRKLVPEEEAKSLPYIPNTDQIKSVLAAANVMGDMNEKTDSENLIDLWVQLKELHDRYKLDV